MKKFLKTNYIYIYYLIFVSIYIIAGYSGYNVSMPLRFLFVGAMLIPAFKDRNWCTSVVLFSIILMRYGSGAGALFPTHDYFYLVICLFFLLYYLHSYKFSQLFSTMIVLFVYCCIIDVFIEGTIIRQLFMSFIITIICFQLFDNKKTSLEKISFLLICSTLALSATFIGLSQNYDFFLQESFERTVGESRSGWFDPNYFGTVLGMGSIASLIELYHDKKLSIFLKILYIFTYVLSLIALLKIASRGALIALIMSSSLLLFESKVKLYYKICICILSILFIYYLYNNDYMNIILYRVENQGLESGRLDIWKDKISTFINLELSDILFGIGNSGVVELGYLKGSMHNDFLSCFVQYGFIGLLIFVVLIFKPVVKLFKYNKRFTYTLTATVYLVICLLSLNPVTGGQAPYYFFIAYIYFIAKTYDGFALSNNEKKSIQ